MEHKTVSYYWHKTLSIIGAEDSGYLLKKYLKINLLKFMKIFKDFHFQNCHQHFSLGLYVYVLSLIDKQSCYP